MGLKVFEIGMKTNITGIGQRTVQTTAAIENDLYLQDIYRI